MIDYLALTQSAPVIRVAGIDVISFLMILGMILVFIVPVIIVSIITSSVKRNNCNRARMYEEELKDIIGQLRRAKENGADIPAAEKSRLIEREHQLVLSLKTKYKGLTENDYSNFDFEYDY